ncbi:MAG TPA: hypothetical protein VMF52_03730 [Steroidobacteraceae bacterium]|nr:hypothetical protein [Steroidobacteraceae bacterium]
MSRGQAQKAEAAGGVVAGQRRIALVGAPSGAADERGEHAMRLLDTMLWVLKGTTRDAWSKAEPDDADIIVIHRGDEPTRTAAWRSRGKLIVEIAREGETGGADDNVLTYPFPAKRVLELLEKLSGKLDDSSPAPAVSAAPAPVARATISDTDRWALPEALRTVRSVRNDNLWLVARDGADPVLWLRGDGSAYFATDAFVRTLHADGSLTTRLELRDGYPPPKTRVAERPAGEFFWFAGFNAGDGLAPWLDSRQSFRITAWPDFGVIRPDAAVLRAVALLQVQSLDVGALAARARVTHAVAARILNALSLCEVLVAGEARASRGEARLTEPRGGFSGFLRRLRTHLGLGVEA